MIDQNTYALSISLALETQSAFDSLDDFGQHITDLESNLADAAQKSLQTLGTISAQTSQSIAEINRLLDQVAAHTLKIQTNFGDASKELTDQYDTSKDQLKDLQEKLKLEREESKIREDGNKFLQDDLEYSEKFVKSMDHILESIKLKNLGHAEQNRLLGIDVDLVNSVNSNLTDSTKEIGNANAGLAKSGIGWRTIIGWVQNADKDTEKFVTTNYRVYASQMQLLDLSRQMSMETGVFQENAIEAYRALADVKTPRESIGKLAQDVGMATRVTGVSVDVWARYTRGLRGAGLTADQISKQISTVAAAQRKLGLSTEDVTRAINNQKLSAVEQAGFFGKDAPEKFQIAQLALAGMRKEMGYSEKASEELGNALMLTGIDGMVFWQQMGVAENAGLEEKFAALTAGVTKYANTVNGSLVPAIEAGNELSAEQKFQLGTVAEQMHLSVEATLMAIRARKALIGTDKEYLLTLDGARKGLQAEMNLQKQHAEANQAFTGAMKQLLTVWTSFYQRILSFLANALTPLIKALTWVSEAIAVVVDNIIAFNRWLEKIPVIGQVISVLNWASDVAIALGLAFIFVSAALGSFGIAIAGFGGLLGRFTAGIQFVITTMLSLARAFGQAIVIILTSLGQGLAALGNAVKGVIVPLIALGIAFALTGVGAYLFARSVQIIAETGAAAIPAMFGMIAATAVLGAVLVGLAMLVQGPVALGLLVLSVAFVAVGVAALAVGAGLYLAGMGISMLSESLSFGLIAKFTLLGVALVALGAMALVAMPGIFALGIAMTMLAVAAVIMAAAFYVVAAAIKLIGADALPAVGEALLTAGWKFAEAAALFAVAGAALVAGAVLLAGAVLIIAAVAVEIVIAGGALLIGGALLAAGAGLVSIAGDMLKNGGAGVAIGGASLLHGLTMLVMAAPMILTAGSALTLGAAAIAVGAAILLPASGVLALAGLTLLSGSTALLAAAVLLSQASPMLEDSGRVFVTSGANMISGSTMLAAAGALMLAAGAALVTGSGLLGVAGLALTAGLYMLSDSSQEVYNIGVRVGVGGIMMLTGANALIQAAGLLGDAADYIGKGLDILATAAQRLGSVSALLGSAAVSITQGSMYYVLAVSILKLGSMILVSAADGMLLGAGDLMAAGELLEDATVSISSSMGELVGSGRLAIYAGMALAVGSASLGSAAVDIVDSAILLGIAGSFLKPAAWSVYSGLMTMESAVHRFSKTLDKVEKVSQSMALLAAAFYSLHTTPLSGLKALSEETLSAVPNIEKLGTGLEDAAKKLDLGVRAFQGPAERLNSILSMLTETIVSFGSGLDLADDVGRLAEMLDQYANLLENASERIETAVVTKAIPAMRAAERAGIEETVRSEAITTVKMITQTDGNARDVDDEATRMLTKISTTMTSIDDRLATMQTGGTELSEIIAILQAYLPGINKGDSGLGSELNSWAR
jgi:hypothetical protein